jgi:hypothetical protein
MLTCCKKILAGSDQVVNFIKVGICFMVTWDRYYFPRETKNFLMQFGLSPDPLITFIFYSPVHVRHGKGLIWAEIIYVFRSATHEGPTLLAL